ncbi:hypothetical protein PCE1_001509 [Barthelona sp. PCE]
MSDRITEQVYGAYEQAFDAGTDEAMGMLEELTLEFRDTELNEYIKTLFMIIGSEDFEVDFHLFAYSQISTVISAHWKVSKGSDYEPVSDELRESIITALFSSLCDDDKRIRAKASDCLHRVVSNDSIDTLNDIMEKITILLQSDDISQVFGGLSALKECVYAYDIKVFSEIGTGYLNMCLPYVAIEETCTEAMSTLSTVVTHMYTLSVDFCTELAQYLIFDYFDLNNLVKLCGVITSTVSEYEVIEPLVEPMFELLKNHYFELSDDQCQAFWNFFVLVVTFPKIRHMLKSYAETLFYLSFYLSAPTKEHLEDWQEDTTAFIQAGSEDYSDDLRMSMSGFWVTLFDSVPTTFLVLFNNLIQMLFEDVSMLEAAMSEHFPLQERDESDYFETLFYLLRFLNDSVQDNMYNDEFDGEVFMNMFVNAFSAENLSIWARCRLLITYAQFSSIFDEFVPSFIEMLSDLFDDASYYQLLFEAIRIAGTEGTDMNSLFPKFITAWLDSAKDSVGTDSASLYVDALTSIIPKDWPFGEEETDTIIEGILTLLFDMLEHKQSFDLVGMAILDCIVILSTQKTVRPTLFKLLAPLITEQLSEAVCPEPDEDLERYVDFVVSMLSPCSTADEVMDLMGVFSPILAVLEVSECSLIITSAVGALRHFVRLFGEHFTDEHWDSIIEGIQHVFSKPSPEFKISLGYVIITILKNDEKQRLIHEEWFGEVFLECFFSERMSLRLPFITCFSRLALLLDGDILTSLFGDHIESMVEDLVREVSTPVSLFDYKCNMLGCVELIAYIKELTTPAVDKKSGKKVLKQEGPLEARLLHECVQYFKSQQMENEEKEAKDIDEEWEIEDDGFIQDEMAEIMAILDMNALHELEEDEKHDAEFMSDPINEMDKETVVLTVMEQIDTEGTFDYLVDADAEVLVALMQ